MGKKRTDEDGRTMCGTPSLRGYTDPDADGRMGLQKAPMTCGRMTCPHCYDHWLRTTTFKIASTVEARSHLEGGSRPAHLTYGPRDTTASVWTDDEIYRRHQRRGVRRLKAVGVLGGFTIRHDYRVRADRWKALRDAGWTGKKWEAIREDRLDLGGWWEYVRPGLHSHAITTNSWLAPHRQEDFNLHKIRYLETLEDTVGAVRYVLSHATTLEGENDRAVSRFGSVYGWEPDTDPDMDPAVLLDIRTRVARAVGMVWNDITKVLEYPPKEAELGEAVPPAFKPIGQLHQDMTDRAWTATLSDGQWAFIDQVYRSMRGEGQYAPWLPAREDGVDGDAVHWTDDVPSDMKVWGTVPEPAPWTVADDVADDVDDDVVVGPPDGSPFYENLTIIRHDRSGSGQGVNE